MRSARRSVRARGAFTLIELLLSLVIMGLMMVAVAGATYVSTHTYETNQTLAELGNSGRAIMQRATREIRAAASVTCSTNRLTIIPADITNGPDQIDYLLEEGRFYCDRTDGGAMERYLLLGGTGDQVSVTQFEITITTATREEVTYTAMVSVKLGLLANGQPMAISGSACPRQNVSP